MMTPTLSLDGTVILHHLLGMKEDKGELPKIQRSHGTAV